MIKMKSYKYITIYEIEQKPKTSVYCVDNRRSGNKLATIKWYSAWRQYCFEPEINTIWNDECLKDIVNFLERLKSNSKGERQSCNRNAK